MEESLGGLARRAGMISELRAEYEDVLLIDGGDFFWPQEHGPLMADFTARALELMRYDAINVADGDLAQGLVFLEKRIAAIRDRMISANLYKDGKALFQPYIVKTIKGARIAVVGLVSPRLSAQQKAVAEDGIEVREMAPVLAALMPRLKKDADTVVVLSHAGWDESVQLAKQVDGISAIVVSHQYYYEFDPQTIGGTLLVKSGIGGKHLGHLSLWLGKNKKAGRQEVSLIELSADIQDDPELHRLEMEFERKRGLEAARKN